VIKQKKLNGKNKLTVKKEETKAIKSKETKWKIKKWKSEKKQK